MVAPQIKGRNGHVRAVGGAQPADSCSPIPIQRGIKGGYNFARPSTEITVLEVVELLDGAVGQDAKAAGHLRATLEAAGTPIGPYDILIAAQALRMRATLVTGNISEFARVRGLVCQDWGAKA